MRGDDEAMTCTKCNRKMRYVRQQQIYVCRQCNLVRW